MKVGYRYNLTSIFSLDYVKLSVLATKFNKLIVNESVIIIIIIVVVVIVIVRNIELNVIVAKYSYKSAEEVL